MENNCIFCKIIAGEIPSYCVYEDEDFKAILDVNPSARGHVIILPKKHAADIFELSDEYVSKVMIEAKKIAKAVKEAYHCDGINILQNNGEAAGQTVFHLHVHVIPRFEGDTKTINIGWKPMETPEDMAAVVEEIRSHL